MEAYLVCRLFEYCQFSEGCFFDFSINEVLHISEYSVICHRTFNNIIVVLITKTAACDEIKPFFAHLRKSQDFKAVIRSIYIFIYKACACISCCQSTGLFGRNSAVKAKIEIFIVFSSSYFWELNY